MGNEQGKQGGRGSQQRASNTSASGGSQQNQSSQRSSNRPKCNPPNQHVYPQLQLCSNGNCSTQICENCASQGPQDNKRYCQLCIISIIKMQDGSDSDDDMAFSSPASTTSNPSGGFQKIAVKRDASTGEITGWQDFYAMARIENPDLQQEEQKHSAMFAQAQEQLAVSTQPTYIVLKQQDRLAERIVCIKNSATGEQIPVQAVQKGGMTVELKHLPPEVDAYSYNYTNQEKWENFKEVIECLVTMHATLTGAIAETRQEQSESEDENQVMPSTLAYQQDLETFANFKREDPSQYYDITSKYKLGSGGFAKVFKVLRKRDNKVIALKFIQNLKDEREKQLMYNEVALMNMCAENDFVLRIYEQFEYKGCLWIFVEIMDDALTPVIARMRSTYSENACKYVLRQTLLGLQYLHARHIIHRDIKSDNILVDKQGQVKLADFGYSAQLTTERDARSSKVGTVCWMAPELIRGERRYDTKVDIWSYGIFAMELANGDPPYISEPQHRVIMNIVKKNPPPLQERWSSVFQDFVNKCLTKDPRQRWSADQLLEHEFLRDAADHKNEFGRLITQFCEQRDEAKAKRNRNK